MNIVQAEIWKLDKEPELTTETIGIWDDHAFMGALVVSQILQLRQFYPIYQVDEFYAKNDNIYPNVLMINGELDPATAGFQVANLVASVQGRKFVSVPLAGHAIAFMGEIGPDLNCPTQIITDFLFGKGLDSSCVQEMDRFIDFGGKTRRVKDAAKAMFGTEDLWGTGDKI